MLSGGDGDDLFVGDLDPTLYERLDADSRTKKEVIEAALEREYTTTEQHRLELRLDHRRSQKQMLERERRELTQEIARLDDEIAAIEEQLEDIESEEDAYADTIDDLLDEMAESGMSVWPTHGRVSSIASTHDVDAETVVETLKDRAEERDLGLPDNQFEEGHRGGL